MKLRRFLPILILPAAAFLLAAGPSSPNDPKPLTVFAASSLTEAFGEIAAAFEVSHPGVDVELNFAGSQILRMQIEEGAPADVFASADFAQMEPLAKAGDVGTPAEFAKNRLVVVASRKSELVKALEDLSKPHLRIVVAGRTVPIGEYTAQVIAKINNAKIAGKHFAARFASNVVSRETNVRAVLSKVMLGEADAGIVYFTDVGDAEDILVIEIPEEVNAVAEYPIATVRASKFPELAQEFVDAVLSSAGGTTLAKHGFTR